MEKKYVKLRTKLHKLELFIAKINKVEAKNNNRRM
jgi:hypothetical protein